MKYLFSLFFFLFLIPGVVSAKESLFQTTSANGEINKAQVVTTSDTATITVFRENIKSTTATIHDLSVNTLFTNSDACSANKVFSTLVNLGPSNSYRQTYTVPKLSPNTTYCLQYSLLDKAGNFSTETTAASQSQSVQLMIQQGSGTIAALFTRPKTDTRPYTLEIRQNGALKISKGLSTAQKITSSSNIALQTIISIFAATGSDVYIADLKDINTSIGEGTYTAIITTLNTTNNTVLALSAAVPLTTTSTTITSAWPLTYDADETKVVITGKIDIAKHPDFKNFKIKVEYTTSLEYRVANSFPSDATKQGYTVKHTENNESFDINPKDGTYKVEISSLQPSTYYYIRQTITAPNGSTDVQIDQFNSSKGHTPIGGEDEVSDFETRSYRLLAPWPGLAIVLDPDLCVEKKVSGEDGQICNISDFINFALRVIIGITAIILVIKLMLIGYSYLTTDIPAIKVNAKSSIMTTVGGLLLALSSWVILNTINPTLVSDIIALDAVGTGTEVWDRATDPNFIRNLESVSTTGITINPENYSDPTFLAYLSHQQGMGGAAAILWAANRGYNAVPTDNGFVKSDKINRNMLGNFNKADARKVIGTDVLTPVNFVKYWATKVEAFKREGNKNILPKIDIQLQKVATETGVDIALLRAACKIESQDRCQTELSITKVNDLGYAGLFQLSNSIHQKRRGVWEQYKKPDGVLIDAYHNTYVAALYAKDNINYLTKNWAKIIRK